MFEIMEIGSLHRTKSRDVVLYRIRQLDVPLVVRFSTLLVKFIRCRVAYKPTYPETMDAVVFRGQSLYSEQIARISDMSIVSPDTRAPRRQHPCERCETWYDPR